MSDRKIKSIPLDSEWAASLLRVPLTEPVDLDVSEIKTVGGVIEEARHLLWEGVRQARKSLDQNPLTEVVAKEAARKANKRGRPDLIVTDNGDIHLVVKYGRSKKVKEEPPNEHEHKRTKTGMSFGPVTLINTHSEKAPMKGPSLIELANEGAKLASGDDLDDLLSEIED